MIVIILDYHQLWEARIIFKEVLAPRLLIPCLLCSYNRCTDSWSRNFLVASVFKSVVRPVVDAEVMLVLNSILMDIVCNEDMVLFPHTRNVEWIQTKMRKPVGSFPFLSVVNQHYFFYTLFAAGEYSPTVQYPIDNLITSPLTGTYMLEIKDMKPMEPELEERGVLSSSDGTELMKLSGNHSNPTGSRMEAGISFREGNL